MDIEKELEAIFGDPLLDISPRQASLFDIPNDMRKATARRNKADYIAQRRACADFERYCPLFSQVHDDLRRGRRSLVRISKTSNLQAGHYYVADGQMLLLERIGEKHKSSNDLPDGRTRCIYENGTETDILLQTLRKSVVGNGFAVTELQEETESKFFTQAELTPTDRLTGFIYVLRSLSDNPAISSQQDLYKIGFSTNDVEERIAGAAHDPTYLMAPVRIVATYKVANMNSQKLEGLIHQVLEGVRFHVTVFDDSGQPHEPQEWFVVPLSVVDTIIEKIMDGSIVGFTYNAHMKCLERRADKQRPSFSTRGLSILSLSIKRMYFDAIVSGEKRSEYRQLKQTNLNKYTYVDAADGKRYLRRYDALRLTVGHRREGESALVQVVDTTCADGIVEYHLGAVLEHTKPV